MGIGSTTFNKYMQFYQDGIFNDIKSVMDFGSQEIFAKGEEENLKQLFSTFGITDISEETIAKIANRGSAREMYENLGLTYNCIDVDGQFGALPLDLNYEDVPPEHYGAYDLVTNFGSTELSVVKIAQTLTKPDLARKLITIKLSKTKMLGLSGFQDVFFNSFT